MRRKSDIENTIKTSSYNHSFFNIHKRAYKNYQFSKPKETGRPVIQNMEIYKERSGRVNIPGLSLSKVKIKLNETRDYQFKGIRRIPPNNNTGYLMKPKKAK